MSIGSAIGGAEETVDLVAIVAIVAIAIYLYYKYPDMVQSVKDDLSAVSDAVYTPSFPGGGQIEGSSETYQGALDETLSHPGDTIKTILTQNCFTCGASDIALGTCNIAEYGEQVCL